MDLVAALVLVLGGDSGSPVDRVLPEPVSVRIRLLTVREGMSPEEVIRRLGLKDRLPMGGGGTIMTYFTTYRFGRTYELTLWYSRRDGKDFSYGFTNATWSVRERP